jgi:hypothetical protein
MRKIFALLLLLLMQPSGILRAESHIKPGETIGPRNWEKVKDMLPANLLKRLQQGWTIRIKQPYVYQPPKEFVEATEKYSRNVRLDSNDGNLLNYVAGLPFPQMEPRDPQAGLKVAWNFYWRWEGDDYKNGGATAAGQVVRYAIEKDGSERRADFVAYLLFPRTRVTLNPKPVLPGYEQIDKIQLRIDTYPRDSSGTTLLEIRYADPKRPDDLYLYIPTLRRVRRGITTQRCQTLTPSEFNLDDVNVFNGKITDFNYRLLGEKKILTMYSQTSVPYKRKNGDYLPLDEGWQVLDVYALEITPKDSGYCYSKKVIWVDQTTWEAVATLIWDQKGEYYREGVNGLMPAKLPDGRTVWSHGGSFIANLKNGRSTVLGLPRSYNNGYSPSMFTVPNMLQVMRGGDLS